MMRFATPILAYSVEVHSRCIGRPPGLSQALEGRQKGGKTP
jgi:hypothetical protein